MTIQWFPIPDITSEEEQNNFVIIASIKQAAHYLHRHLNDAAIGRSLSFFVNETQFKYFNNRKLKKKIAAVCTGTKCNKNLDKRGMQIFSKTYKLKRYEKKNTKQISM